MEVVIIKQANPPVVLSKKNHCRTYFPVLRGSKSLVQREGLYLLLWDEGAQHLTESHIVKCRICASEHGNWDLQISPPSAELVRHNIMNVQNSR